MAIKTRLGAERYNNRMAKIYEDARRLERERLERGEMPNPSLTSPDVALKYGWEITGRDVKKRQDWEQVVAQLVNEFSPLYEELTTSDLQAVVEAAARKHYSRASLVDETVNEVLEAIYAARK